MRTISSWTPFVAATLALAFASGTAAREVDDAFLAGYVSAVLEREFALAGALRGVREGAVSLERGRVPASARQELFEALQRIDGVSKLRWVGSDSDVAAAPEREGVVFLPPRPLFDPLIADPRWPGFSAARLTYLDDPDVTHAGAVSMGGSVPLLQGELASATWQLGIQAAVFSLFDLDAESLDLVNSDFWVGIPASLRLGKYTGFVRLYHQSSHLGDEFLLRSRIERVNLSYEGVDALVAYEPLEWLRVYGGGGILIHREPDDLERLSAQAGIELYSPRTFLRDLMRPILGLDIHSRQESDWRADYSLRAGVQLENARMFGGRRLQLLAEYYKGRSPNGQFWERKLEYLGLGLHLHF